MIRTALIAAALLTAAGAAPQSTRAETAPATVVVTARDLATPDGAKAFYRDVTRAAAEVCGGQRTYGGLSAMAEFDDCYRRTVREVVEKAHAPLVTAAAKARPVRVAAR